MLRELSGKWVGGDAGTGTTDQPAFLSTFSRFFLFVNYASNIPLSSNIKRTGGGSGMLRCERGGVQKFYFG